jgi:hypothetical protein
MRDTLRGVYMLLPIPSGRKLSVFEIAKLWSRETKPPAPHQELLIAIGQAWWRGELVAANGPSRLKVLGALYSTCRDSIAFIIPGMTAPPLGKLLDDGRWEVFLRIPLPNGDPDTWTEANCAEAFEVIAKEWDEVACEEWFHLAAPIVAGIVLTQREFNQWIDKMHYSRPNFWGVRLRRISSPPTIRRHASRPESIRALEIIFEMPDANPNFAHPYAGLSLTLWIITAI